MIKCPVCGKETKESHNFCPYCGFEFNLNNQPLEDPVFLNQLDKRKDDWWTVAQKWIGIAGIVVTFCLLAFSHSDETKDWRYWPIYFSTIGLLYPWSLLKKQVLGDDEVKCIVAIASFAAAFVFGIFTKEDQHGFWKGVFYALSTKDMCYFYLVSLVFTSILSSLRGKWGLYAACGLKAILLPIIIFSVLDFLIKLCLFIAFIAYAVYKVFGERDDGC